MIELLNASILSLVLDRGGFSHTHLGVKASGVMDEYAQKIANILLVNADNTNTIEINFPHTVFKVHSQTVMVLTGANCDFFINNKPKKMWKTYTIKKGDTIKIGSIKSGVRVYLSVKGGFMVNRKPWGLSQKKMLQGDYLEYTEYTKRLETRLKLHHKPEYKSKIQLRVLLSYQESFFSQEEKEKFFTSTYEVSTQIGRMAYKLQGEPIKTALEGVISEGIAFGSIQIPKDGQPIVLLKERQTIGGYPKIGVVLDVDCFKLAQAKPQTQVEFKEISFDEAVKISKKFHSLGCS